MKPPAPIRHNLWLVTILSTLVAGSVANAATIVLNPSKDNSMYSESTNSNALGNLYIGRTLQGGVRRALIQFDIAGSVPAGATINSVKLELNQTKLVDASARTFELHVITTVWGEGTSFTTPGAGGQGAAATSGDATWTSAQFGANLWTTPGGDFVLAASGTTSVGTSSGFSAFNSQPGMVADVQSWLGAPSSNFGWLVKLTDETTGGTAREFSSRNINPAPKLTIDFTPVPEPTSSLLWFVTAGIVASRRSRRR